MKALWVFVCVLGVFVVTGCLDKEVEGERNRASIVSDRFNSKKVSFKGEPQFIALLQLKKNPSLLATSTRSNGKIQVQPELLQALVKEQGEMIEKLKSISPEIEILYTYRMVLNAIAVVVPQRYEGKISELEGVFVEPDERFAAPIITKSPWGNIWQQEGGELSSVSVAQSRVGVGEGASQGSLVTKNSVTFIGADRVHQRQVVGEDGISRSLTGHGVRVGIIDSGIDYTHSALGGSGLVSDYESIDPNKTSLLFPNAKVVGGVDFVGENFNTRSLKFEDHIPKPDDNPLDKTQHGSHVGGTVAGMGGGYTHVGVAPDAQLVALKIFGDKGGSTSDTVTIAALEYAADPNGDLDPRDRLDVVNLSLGSDYGAPHGLYQQAIGNLAKGGSCYRSCRGQCRSGAGLFGGISEHI